MKKTILGALSLMLVQLATFAQDFSGVIKYNMVNDPSKMFANNPNADRMRAQFGNFAEQARRPRPYLLTVKGNESVYKGDNTQDPGETTVEINGERRSFRMRAPKDETYYNLDTKKFRKYEEYAQQPFQVSGDFESIRWKVDPTQTRQILGYECMMATGTDTERRMFPSPNASGQMSFKDTVITNQLTAWFTDAIPTSAGPDKYNGLPGLILALDINDGVTTYVATNVEAKALTEDDLKVNSKGKKVTPEQLKKIKDDHQAEQMKNFRGGSPGGPVMIMRGN